MSVCLPCEKVAIEIDEKTPLSFEETQALLCADLQSAIAEAEACGDPTDFLWAQYANACGVPAEPVDPTEPTDENTVPCLSCN